MIIKKDTLEDLFDNNILIENIFYMQLVTACDSMPESFFDVFQNEPCDLLRAIGIADPSVGDDLTSESELLEFLHDKRVKGVLIHFSTPQPRNFSFNSSGEFSSCSISWGVCMNDFAYGQTLEEALESAVSLQDKYFSDCILSAKKEELL